MSTPGLIVPPLTPFTANLEVDEDALQREVDYVVEDCNAQMVVAAGVEAQEYHYLTLEQRKRLVRRTFEFVAGRCPVTVGISHASFKIAIELAHLAQDLGAASVQLLVPLRPFGGEPTTAEMVAYFEAVAREIQLPILLYLNPGPGATVSVPATIELAKLPTVFAVKESSRDLSRCSQLIVEIQKAGHAQYYTTLQMLLISLQLGGAGCTLPPPAAELANKIVQAFVAGNWPEAARLQAQFSLFPAKWMHRGLAPTMKAAMALLGRGIGEPYPPYPPLNAAETQALAQFLATTDFKKKEH